MNRWIFADTAEYAWRGWLPTDLIAFPGEPERFCDTVSRWRHRE